MSADSDSSSDDSSESSSIDYSFINNVSMWQSDSPSSVNVYSLSDSSLPSVISLDQAKNESSRLEDPIGPSQSRLYDNYSSEERSSRADSTSPDRGGTNTDSSSVYPGSSDRTGSSSLRTNGRKKQGFRPSDKSKSEPDQISLSELAQIKRLSNKIENEKAEKLEGKQPVIEKKEEPLKEEHPKANKYKNELGGMKFSHRLVRETTSKVAEKMEQKKLGVKAIVSGTKNVEQNKDDLKIDESKKDETKKGDSKKDEPKKNELKKGQPKKIESKTDQLSKEEQNKLKEKKMELEELKMLEQLIGTKTVERKMILGKKQKLKKKILKKKDSVQDDQPSSRKGSKDIEEKTDKGRKRSDSDYSTDESWVTTDSSSGSDDDEGATGSVSTELKSICWLKALKVDPNYRNPITEKCELDDVCPMMSDQNLNAEGQECLCETSDQEKKIEVCECKFTDSTCCPNHYCACVPVNKEKDGDAQIGQGENLDDAKETTASKEEIAKQPTQIPGKCTCGQNNCMCAIYGGRKSDRKGSKKRYSSKNVKNTEDVEDILKNIANMSKAEQLESSKTSVATKQQKPPTSKKESEEIQRLRLMFRTEEIWERENEYATLLNKCMIMLQELKDQERVILKMKTDRYTLKKDKKALGKFRKNLIYVLGRGLNAAAVGEDDSLDELLQLEQIPGVFEFIDILLVQYVAKVRGKRFKRKRKRQRVDRVILQLMLGLAVNFTTNMYARYNMYCNRESMSLLSHMLSSLRYLRHKRHDTIRKIVIVIMHNMLMDPVGVLSFQRNGALLREMHTLYMDKRYDQKKLGFKIFSQVTRLIQDGEYVYQLGFYYNEFMIDKDCRDEYHPKIKKLARLAKRRLCRARRRYKYKFIGFRERLCINDTLFFTKYNRPHPDCKMNWRLRTSLEPRVKPDPDD